MPFRTYFGIVFFTILFLFYPGDSRLFSLIAHNGDLFRAQVAEKKVEIQPFPLKPASGPAITAGGAYIIDLDSFTPVFTRNADSRFYPASTTKVITALVAEDVFDEDQIITIKRVLNEGQVMGLNVNEKITVENLLYGILVHSGNDAAYALADAYGYDKFIDLMNQKAKELGMKNSHFTNPAGLDQNDQYSTPHDLTLAARQVLLNKTLKKMVGTKEITISDVDYRVFHRLSNVNQLLGQIQGVGGLKTGYTENAGENLVSFYKRYDGKQFIIVVLKSEDRFEDTKQIIDWLQQIRYTEVQI